MGGSYDSRLPRPAVLDIVIVALLAAAGAVAWTGGGRFEVFGMPVSARDWTRPLAAALILFGASYGRRVLRRHIAAAEAAHRLAGLVTAALIAAALASTAAFIIPAVGGLDSHGYAAFSKLLSRGQLARPLPDLSWLGVEHPADVAAPLGFIPSTDGSALVPEFPVGVPLLMAAARLVTWGDAVYWVAWLCQVLLVVVIFLLATQRYGTLTASLAAALMAAHPVAAAYAMQSMSDVPATLFTVLAVYWLARPQPRPLLAGCAGAMAILARPPLLLPMFVLGVWSLIKDRRLKMGSDPIFFAAGVLPGVLGLMWLQWTLFGHPLVSGHGSAGRLFAGDVALHNLAAHGKWFLIVHTPLIVPALWLGWRSDRRFATLAFAVAASEALPYIFYGVRFDDWEMLRFLLPGVAVLVPVAAAGVATLLRRVPGPAAQQWAVAGLALAALVTSGRWLDSHGILTLPDTEVKYPRAADIIDARAPDNAVVLASLHSGSIQYYSGRVTLRWDALPPDRLASAVTAARDRGMPMYAVLEQYELPQFERRFSADLGSSVDLVPIDRFLTVLIAEVTPR